MNKYLSRKFLMALAAVLASLGTSISGISSGNEKLAVVGIICTVASAAIYAGCEAYVDAAHKFNIAAEEVEETEGGE